MYIRLEDCPDVLTPTTLQNVLGIGRSNTYALLRSGTIRSIRVGVKYLVPKKAVVDFLETATTPINTN